MPLKACGNGAAPNVTKPVVIVDGIDYEGTREGGDIYGEYLAYRDGTRVKNLGAELRDEGYDVVMLDFPNLYGVIRAGFFVYYGVTRHSGADFMERNAYTLVTLIQQLNQQMQAAGSTENVVVVGPSMGGQVARYALTYMEANNIAHNTRLFVSLDSPNNGATIPIGLQHFVKFFADETEDETAVNNLALLDSPASLELALHYYGQGTAFQADPLRTSFLNSLSSLGNYPSQLRRVAVTDGAIDGTLQRDQNGQNIQANQQAFGLEQRGLPNDGSVVSSLARILWPVAAVGRLVTLAAARVYYAPGYGQTRQVLYAYKFPHGHYQEAVGPAGSCGLDGAPGGFRYFFSFATNSRGDLFEKRNFYSVRDKACFIPTLSGLGYTQAADNCMAAGQNLVCAGTTPFDAYYGPTGHNDEHLHLTPANVEFMRNEILKKTPTPVFATAPNGICPNGGTAQFSVAAECARAGQPGTTYTWTAGPGLAIVGGQGTATVTVQSAVGYGGTTTLQVVAIRSGYATSAPATVPVYIGDGYLVINDGVGPDRCPERGMKFAITDGFGTQGAYTWSVNHGRISSGQGSASIFVSALPFDDYQLQVSVRAAGTCAGASVVEQTYSQHVYPTAPGNIGQCDLSRSAPKATPAAYPNPADDVLTLATPETREATATRTAVLYNGQGREVRRTHAGEARLATAGLPAGLYYLMVEQNGQVTRSQIRVQH
jgi:pimeloyl-ACP methyl ester carboxylesterase